VLPPVVIPLKPGDFKAQCLTIKESGANYVFVGNLGGSVVSSPFIAHIGPHAADRGLAGSRGQHRTGVSSGCKTTRTRSRRGSLQRRRQRNCGRVSQTPRE
jgi:hypothetical protein